MWGVYLLKTSGKLAELRNSWKVKLENVIKDTQGRASLSTSLRYLQLNSYERVIVRYIYEGGDEEVAAGIVYDAVREEMGMSYKKFCKILEKLERLKLIDFPVSREGACTVFITTL